MKAKNFKTGLVVGLFPEQYRVANPRLNKPVCHQRMEQGKVTGSMLLQDLETATIDGGKEINYFCPNNVAVLLSVSSKALGKAIELHKKFFHSPDMEFRIEEIEEDKNTFLNRVSVTKTTAQRGGCGHRSSPKETRFFLLSIR